MTGPRRLSCTLHAPRETVFRTWTEARHIKAWFAPEGFTVPEATIEPHEGGRFDLCMASPAGERHWIRGRFEQIEPNQRLVVAMRITDVSASRCLMHTRPPPSPTHRAALSSTSDKTTR